MAIFETRAKKASIKETTMVRGRKSAERGHYNHGWLETYHTFSFSGYHDPRHMSFRSLRVMNEDFIAPGRGFGTHDHDNMEIVTYVLEGALEHRDSLGTGDVLRAGELQRMTAGAGISHSEFNASSTDPVHLYQIWLFPDRAGLEPSYDQKAFPVDERHNRLRMVASPDGSDGSLVIRQDARLFLGSLDADHEVIHALAPGRHAWLQVLRGRVAANGLALAAGDGAAVSDERALSVRASETSEVLLFDLS
jgi:redox-sensitive bicupin YhaK (pirin superfamily)